MPILCLVFKRAGQILSEALCKIPMVLLERTCGEVLKKENGPKSVSSYVRHQSHK